MIKVIHPDCIAAVEDAARLRESLCHRVPDIPMILCTGFSEKINEKTALDFPIDVFLMKPVDTNKMAKTVRKVLDKND